MREIIMCALLAAFAYAFIMQCVQNVLTCFRDEDEQERGDENAVP